MIQREKVEVAGDSPLGASLSDTTTTIQAHFEVAYIFNKKGELAEDIANTGSKNLFV